MPCLLGAVGCILIEVVFAPVENGIGHATRLTGGLGPTAGRVASDGTDNQPGRNVVEEARWLRVLRLAEDGAAAGAYQVEAAHRPCEADVGQAAFLLQLLRLAHRARVWQRAFVHAHDEDDGKLQSLGGVEGDERYGVALLVIYERAVLTGLRGVRAPD